MVERERSGRILDATDLGFLHLDEREPGAGVIDADGADTADPIEGEHYFGLIEDLVDGFCEAYNARNLEGVYEVLADDVELPGLGHDREGLTAAVSTLWDDHPHAVLVRGLLQEEPVAVLWDIGDGGVWQRTSLLSFDGDPSEGALGVVELIDHDATVESALCDAPDGDLLEGMRWEEWYEGADDGG